MCGCTPVTYLAAGGTSPPPEPQAPADDGESPVQLEQAHRRAVAVAWTLAVLANLGHAALVPLGGSAAERLDAAAAQPGATELAVALEVAFRIGLCLGAVWIVHLVRQRRGPASVGAALVVAGSLASVLVNVPNLVWAQAPADEVSRGVLVDVVDRLAASPSFLAITVTGLLSLTVGAVLLLIALRPTGWAPTWVLVSFLAGGVASSAAPNERLALLVGAVLTGLPLAFIASRAVREPARDVPVTHH